MTKEHLEPWVENISDPSDRDPSRQFSDYDDGDKDDVLDALQQFCEQLDFRLERFAGKDPAMVQVFENEVNLRAEMLGQKVHTFIGRELIEPVGLSLGYDYVSEPRRSKIELDSGRKKIYPDFRLIPRECPNTTPPDIIVEIKSPGNEGGALKELRTEYLSEVEAPAYGIATDGITWHGRKRHENETIQFEEVSQVPIKSLLNKIRRGIVHDNMSYDREQLRESDDLNRLIRLFSQIPG